MTRPISPLRRALSMTAIFVGPGFLMIILISAFLGALQPMPGAKEALHAEAPDSLVVSMNAGGKGKREPSKRLFLLIPKSFEERVLFVVAKDELSQLSVSRSTSSAFYTKVSIIVVASALTLIVSVPRLWKLYRPHPALIANGQNDETVDQDDHAQL